MQKNDFLPGGKGYGAARSGHWTDRERRQSRQNASGAAFWVSLGWAPAKPQEGNGWGLPNCETPRFLQRRRLAVAGAKMPLLW